MNEDMNKCRQKTEDRRTERQRETERWVMRGACDDLLRLSPPPDLIISPILHMNGSSDLVACSSRNDRILPLLLSLPLPLPLPLLLLLLLLLLLRIVLLPHPQVLCFPSRSPMDNASMMLPSPQKLHLVNPNPRSASLPYSFLLFLPSLYFHLQFKLPSYCLFNSVFFYFKFWS